MFNWRETAQTLLDRDEVFCLVTIEETRGSTPRNVGTIMLVSADTEYGTIGGGNLEYAAIDAARKCLRDGGRDQKTLNYILTHLHYVLRCHNLLSIPSNNRGIVYQKLFALAVAFSVHLVEYYFPFLFVPVQLLFPLSPSAFHYGYLLYN